MERMNLGSAYVTGSILSYMEKEGRDVVKAYLEVCNERNSKPNYSELLRVAELEGGTTRDHIRFESRKASRELLTNYLRGRYSREYGSKGH